MSGRSNASVIAQGMAFTEGPTWIADHGFLLFTDIPASRIMRWSPVDGLSVWKEAAHFAIGLQGRPGSVLACEQAGRSLTSIDITGSGAPGERTVLAASKAGQLLNAPNDVAVSAEHGIIFTDPPFGVRTEDGRADRPGLVGFQVGQERPGCYVYRVTDDPHDPEEIITTIHRPNGVVWNRSETRLYVSDSSEEYHCVYAVDVKAGQFLEPTLFAQMPVGVPDGMCVDEKDHLYVAGGDGVYVYAPSGDQVHHIGVPEMVTNLCFGGPNWDTLYITATTSLYSAEPLTAGKPKEIT